MFLYFIYLYIYTRLQWLSRKPKNRFNNNMEQCNEIKDE